MRSLGSPSSARRMMLARTPSQSRGLFFRAIDSSDSRSSLERRMSYGLFLGIEGRNTSDARLTDYVTESLTKYVTVFTMSTKLDFGSTFGDHFHVVVESKLHTT